MKTSLNIAIVEDHETLREVTASVLREAGHQVFAVAYAEDIDYLMKGEKIDVFIIDLNLPGEDGISLTKRIRQTQPLAGIIMATARGSDEDVANGYASGADIYMTKPVAVEALLAAIESLSRRLGGGKRHLHFAIDMERNQLTGPKGMAALQESEATVLIAYARTPSGLLETGELAALFGMDDEAFSKGALMVRVTRLRKKLREVGGETFDIKSIRGKGYQLTQSLQIL